MVTRDDATGLFHLRLFHLSPRAARQGHGVVEAAADHDVRNVFGVAQARERVAVNDQEVREFAFFKRADVAVHAEPLAPVM